MVALAVLIGIIVLVVALIPFPPPNAVLVLPPESLRVAVLSFEDVSGGEQDLGANIASRIEVGLVNQPGVDVFSRSRLEAIVAEQRLGASGLVDSGTAVQIGNLTGIQSLISGVITNVSEQTVETTITKEVRDPETGEVLRDAAGEVVTEEVSAFLLRANVGVQFQMLSAETGQIISADTLSRTRDSDKVEAGDTLLENIFETFVLLGTTDRLISDALQSIASQIASQISLGVTREFRYGIFQNVRRKGGGLQGVRRTEIFTQRDEQAVVVLFFSRMRPGDEFEVRWIDPTGRVAASFPTTIGRSRWASHAIQLRGQPPGSWRVEFFVNDRRVETGTFQIVEAIDLSPSYA
ncbi:MAG: CsgG/HfaB family protein [Candidatus Bipolaricaulia bacterium]